MIMLNWMNIHNLVTLIVYFAFAYSVYVGIRAVQSIDKRRDKPRAAAVLIVVVGILYLIEGAILALQGYNLVVHPLAAMVNVLNVAVNLIAIKIFTTEAQCESRY